MNQQYFEAQYAEDWQKFDELVQKLESRKTKLSTGQHSQFNQLYRKICHYQSLASQRNYSRILVDQLNNLVTRGYRQLYCRRTHILNSITAFILRDFPSSVRLEWQFFWLASALLYLPGLLIFLGVRMDPNLIYALFDPAQLSMFEAMYNPAHHKLGEAHDAESEVMMFGFYIYNNISVAFRTFAAGILLGLGSIFFLVYNGLIFGAIAAHLSNIHYHTTFYPFVIGHGSFELTAITIAGAAGLIIGNSLIKPGEYTRLEALRRASLRAVKLIYGVIIMLVIAAYIEAFWSSQSQITNSVKYPVGGVLWLIVIAYLVLAGRNNATR